jgi:tetratricopeptide (TPR) repeat protein
MAMYRAGDLTAAMQAWEEVARRAPHFAEVDQYLLRVYRVVGLESYTEGRLQNAIETWSKALQLEPENTQVRRYMDQANAKLQRSQGNRGTR